MYYLVHGGLYAFISSIQLRSEMLLKLSRLVSMFALCVFDVIIFAAILQVILTAAGRVRDVVSRARATLSRIIGEHRLRARAKMTIADEKKRQQSPSPSSSSAASSQQQTAPPQFQQSQQPPVQVVEQAVEQELRLEDAAQKSYVAFFSLFDILFCEYSEDGFRGRKRRCKSLLPQSSVYLQTLKLQ